MSARCTRSGAQAASDLPRIALVAFVALGILVALGLSATQAQIAHDSPLHPVAGIFPQVRDARPLSAGEERALVPLDHFKECDTCPEMVVIPVGSFVMGAPDSEDGSTSDERPQHRVVIARQLAVGRFAVTFDEWDACVAAGGCKNYRPADRGWGRGRRMRGPMWPGCPATPARRTAC